MSLDWIESERDVLLHYLNKNRDALVRVLDGLTEAQQRAAGVPSGTSLLGIVWHLTGVEEHWFQRVFLGLGAERDRDMSMDVPADVTAADVIARYRAACARSDEIVRACADLGTRAAIANPGEEGLDPLRVVMAHMIEEIARHAGQADILRERIDGATEL
jgi:uncharacterized damage-inducible protein DinB